MSDVPWLRDMVDDDELDVLFSADDPTVQSGIRELIAQSSRDGETEQSLIDLLETSIEHQNDDTQASVWTVVVLGEIRSAEAIPALLRALASDDDEHLQDAAGVALLRTGPPALEAIMDLVPESTSVVFRRASYAVLGRVGVLDDAELLSQVTGFFEERFEVERRLPLQESAIEELASAVAEVGAARLLDLLRAVAREDFHGANAPISDAVSRLEEAGDSGPFVGTLTPWEVRYGWLFDEENDEDLQRARVERAGLLEEAELTEARSPCPPSEELDEAADIDPQGFHRGLSFRKDPGTPPS